MKNKELTVWEASCIITGYGIGAGVLAIPYIAQKNGIVSTLIIILLAFAINVLLHLMIAETVQKCSDGAQIVSIFSRFLFRGKWKNLLTGIFFALMAFVLVTNLTAYIAGAADVLSGFLPLPLLLSKVLFYIAAAAVVLFGLKAVALSEKYTIAVIFALIAVLAAASAVAPHHPLPTNSGGLRDGLALFSMVMLSFSAYFSVPQAVEGLHGDSKKIKKAVFIGLTNNLIIILVVTFCTLLSSEEITEVAMTGWSAGIGKWAQIIGSVFTVLAMLTTYWSLSLSLADIIREQFNFDGRLCWLLATLPSFILSLLNIGGFIDFLQLAGGAIAIIVAAMVVPTYSRSRKEIPGSTLGVFGETPFCVLTIIAFILMAVGSLL